MIKKLNYDDPILMSIRQNDETEVFRLLIATQVFSIEYMHEAAKAGMLRVVEFLVKNGLDVTAADHYGSTPLHKAAAFGRFEVIKFLLSCGANINANDSFGRKPLHRAITTGCDVSVIEWMIENGADCHAIDKQFNMSPIALAGHLGLAKVVEALYKHGCNLQDIKLDSQGKLVAPKFVFGDKADIERIECIIKNETSSASPRGARPPERPDCC